MLRYGEKQYWEDRYKQQKDDTFDWLEDFDSLKNIIESLITNKQSKVLIVGCGNSEFSERMYDAGWNHLYNIDISENVINSMKERNKLRQHMKYEIMDVMNLKYPDNFFDFIIDKSTIDVLFCGEDSSMNVAVMMKEIQRVLKINGVDLIVSFGKPESKIKHFEMDHLSFDIKIFSLKKSCLVKEGETNYIYLLKKREDADLISQLNFSKICQEIKNGVFDEFDIEEESKEI